jgi:hypothetical protein
MDVFLAVVGHRLTFFCYYIFGRLVAMMVIEHLLLGFKVMMMYVIDDVPRWIREAIAQQREREREASAKARLNHYVAAGEPGDVHSSSPSSRAEAQGGKSMSARGLTRVGSFKVLPPQVASPADTDEASISTLGTTDAGAHPHRSLFSRFSHRASQIVHSGKESHSTPPDASQRKRPTISPAQQSELDTIHEGRADASLKQASHRSLTGQLAASSQSSVDFADPDERDEPAEGSAPKLSPTDRLVKETASPFGFDPVHMMVLICLPAALHYLQITPWLYIPLAVLFFGYLQTKKDRIDRKMAMGIVSDPTLLKLILEEMPSWPTDSEFQQMVRAQLVPPAQSCVLGTRTFCLTACFFLFLLQLHRSG